MPACDNPAKRTQYLKDWVANYELGDIVAAAKNPALHLYVHWAYYHRHVCRVYATRSVRRGAAVAPLAGLVTMRVADPVVQHPPHRTR